MSAYSTLQQISAERANLVEGAASGVTAVLLHRRRVFSGIRWRGELSL